jgi:hypothetical protein
MKIRALKVGLEADHESGFPGSKSERLGEGNSFEPVTRFIPLDMPL